MSLRDLDVQICAQMTQHTSAFIQLEALTLDPQDEDSERSVSFVQETTEAARGSPRGFRQPYWKTKPPESVYHVKRACTILSATVLMNIKVFFFYMNFASIRMDTHNSTSANTRHVPLVLLKL